MKVLVEEVEQNAIGTLVLLLDLGVLEIGSATVISMSPDRQSIVKLTVQP